MSRISSKRNVGKNKTENVGVGRRHFLRLIAGAGTGIVLVNAGLAQKESGEKPKHKTLVTQSCLGCGGCIAICPTSAIRVIPGGIKVKDDLCVSCGYCQTSCPVDGIRVIKVNDNG